MELILKYKDLLLVLISVLTIVQEIFSHLIIPNEYFFRKNL